MMSEPRPDKKITLDDLLQLKRAERPPTDFWVDFERELRTRQVAAAVEKRRWWFALPRVFHGLARYQVPMGAAAVLAVTFVTLREYREPALDRVFEEPVANAPVVAEAEEVETIPVAPVEAHAIVVASLRPEPQPIQNEVGSRPLAPAVPWSGMDSTDVAVERPLTPSARSIQANLAAAESELNRLLGTRLHTPSRAANAEPLAQLTALREVRREPLFAYNTEIVADTASSDDSRATDRIGRKISETDLYDSVRRLRGEGDRLTVRF